MRGSIVKRVSKDGEPLYYVVYRLSATGKQIWEPAGSRHKDAEAKRSEIASRINKGVYFLPSKILFSELAAEFLLKTKREKRIATYLDYQSVLKNHILPAIGFRPISALSVRDVETFKNDLLQKTKQNGQPLSPKMINNVLIALKTIFNFAERQELVIKNPAKFVDLLKCPRTEREFYSSDQIARLLQASEEPYRTMFLLAALSGLREGELFGLQWGDIDWNQNLIYVRRSVYFAPKEDGEGKRWLFQSPKTEKGVRRVVLSPAAREALEVHRLNMIERDNPHNLIFCTSEGTPYYPGNVIRRYYHPAQDAAGLPRLSFHGLRHSYTSLLAELGLNPKFIQSQLGHASITTTLDIYAHIRPERYSEVGDKLDGKVFQSNTNLTEQSEPAAKARQQLTNTV